MKKFLAVLSIIIALLVGFILGWRVMPKVWPSIKTNIVYQVFPSLKPEAELEEEPYFPESNATLDDEIEETDSLIYYFYKPYCPYCREIEPLMGGLPQTITLPDGRTSNVKLIAIDKLTDDGAALIENYYEKYNIPEEERYVPAVVIGDKHFMPGEEIYQNLLDELVNGAGLNTELINGGERVSK